MQPTTTHQPAATLEHQGDLKKTRICDFAYPDHPAKYVLADPAGNWGACEKDLGDMIHWRFVNHAESVCVTRLEPAHG